MKAPDIYTELVITNFLEKLRKKKAGKAASTGQLFVKAAAPRNTYRAAAMYTPHSSCLPPEPQSIFRKKEPNNKSSSCSSLIRKKKKNEAPCLVKTMVCVCVCVAVWGEGEKINCVDSSHHQLS